MNEKLSFACDYEKGAHPNILARMVETNTWKTAGYGLDDISESARNRIRKACGKENAVVEFLVGGTQTNAVMIDALLRSYQGVSAAAKILSWIIRVIFLVREQKDPFTAFPFLCQS